MISDIEYYFPERLDEAMSSQGIAPSDFEDLDVVSASSIKSYLDGKTVPNLRTAVKIAEFLNVSLDYLCGFDVMDHRVNEIKTNSRKAPWL